MVQIWSGSAGKGDNISIDDEYIKDLALIYIVLSNIPVVIPCIVFGGKIIGGCGADLNAEPPFRFYTCSISVGNGKLTIDHLAGRSLRDDGSSSYYEDVKMTQLYYVK